MLYITTSHKKEFTWHIGNKVPGISPDLVVEIQADGHELEHIQKLFTNKLTIHAPPGEEGPQSIDFDYPSLPMPNKRVCRWWGDFARTIFINL
jgi:hypothetical protein